MFDFNQDLKKKVEEIAHDLTHLEINTIIKPHISGSKMPDMRHALIDIAKLYTWKLSVLGHSPPETPESSDTPLQTHHWGSKAYFFEIRTAADTGLKLLVKKREDFSLTKKEEENVFMLQRIKDLSDQIIGIFDGMKKRGIENEENNHSREDIKNKESVHIKIDFAPSYTVKETKVLENVGPSLTNETKTRPYLSISKHSQNKDLPLPLFPREIVLIRKIWEMGVETIVMQTVIQMDGDVITRIHPNYVLPEHQGIHNFHNIGINTSVTFWKELITILGHFFSTLKKFLLP